MRTTARTLALSLALAGCCMGGAAPPSPTPASAAAGPSGPSAPGCPDIATTIVGTWQREGFVEEYRLDGTYVINGMPGTITWARPGHAVLDVPAGPMHAEYDLALADAVTLLAANADHVGSVYARTSVAPAIPPGCFDLTSAWVGTWTPSTGGAQERYGADGRYAAPGVGQWTISAPGRLHLVNENGATSDYFLGMVDANTALAVSMPPLAPAGVAYTRSL